MKIEIVEKAFGPTLEIEESVTMMKMAKTLGTDYMKIQEYLKESGDSCEGIPYTRYLSVDWAAELKKSFFKMIIEVFTKKWNFRAGIPSSKSLPSKNEILSENFEEAKYITATHKGPYQNVGKSYTEIVKWAEENSVEIKSESIEFYLNDPKEVKPTELETQIYVPCL